MRGTLGISLTTPSAHLFGSGPDLDQQTGVGQGIDAAGQPITSGHQLPGRPPLRVHLALSVGAGGVLFLGGHDLNASVEWFRAVGQRTLLDSAPFTPQTGGSPIPTEATYRLGQRLQCSRRRGARIRSRLALRLPSFPIRQQRGYAREQGNSTVSFWDIYHVSTGATLTVGRAAVTLGVVGAFGGNTTERDLPLVPGQEEIGAPPGTGHQLFPSHLHPGFQLPVQLSSGRRTDRPKF